MAVFEPNAFQMENFTEQKTRICATYPVSRSFIFKGIPVLKFGDLGLEYQCENKIRILSEMCPKLWLIPFHCADVNKTIYIYTHTYIHYIYLYIYKSHRDL